MFSNLSPLLHSIIFYVQSFLPLVVFYLQSFYIWSFYLQSFCVRSFYVRSRFQYYMNEHKWALSPISVISDIGLILISEPPILDWESGVRHYIGYWNKVLFDIQYPTYQSLWGGTVADWYSARVLFLWDNIIIYFFMYIFIYTHNIYILYLYVIYIFIYIYYINT
jgi:hypothetical protein